MIFFFFRGLEYIQLYSCIASSLVNLRSKSSRPRNSRPIPAGPSTELLVGRPFPPSFPQFIPSSQVQTWTLTFCGSGQAFPCSSFTSISTSYWAGHSVSWALKMAEVSAKQINRFKNAKYHYKSIFRNSSPLIIVNFFRYTDINVDTIKLQGSVNKSCCCITV